MKKGIILNFGLIAISSLVFTQNVGAQKLAVSGYDVVNYFASNTAQRGTADFASEHNGATYYFLNAENKKRFSENPPAFLPQFDGYCAFAVAKMNKKVPVDPETFRVDDGKLYLFFNDFWEGKPFNTIVPWINNEAEMEKMANQNWKALKAQ